MSKELRDAARRALAEMSGEADGDVTRLTLEVRAGGRDEMVSVMLRDGQLKWSSTADANGPHVRTALRWIAEGPAAMRSAETPEPFLRASRTPAPTETEIDARMELRVRLAAALDDVVTAVGRAGAVGWDAPSLQESLERLLSDAPSPTPLGVLRWVGRLREALELKSVENIARLLHGAVQLADDLRTERPAADQRRRLVSWLGVTDTSERISDRTLVEIGREWLSGLERGSIERRHLVDLHNGEVFREERVRSAGTISVGSCPRTVTVGLAEVEDSAAPRRIRLMQYEVSLDVHAEDVRRIGATAYRRFGALADRYRELCAAQPGQAEPFVVIAPKRFADATSYDDDDQPLPLARADDPAAVEVLGRSLAADESPQWIAGRLVDSAGALMLVPCLVALPSADAPRLVRLR